MQLHYDAETEAFRAELRAWLADNLPDPAVMRAAPSRSSGDIPEWARAWQRRLFDAGWLVPGWPRELGGRDATPVQQLVYFEELAEIPVMRSYNIQGLTIIVPSIREYGSPEQRERYLLQSLRAELNRGWAISTASLAHERGMLWTSQTARIEKKTEELIALGNRTSARGSRLGDDAAFRDAVAALYVEGQALKFMGYRGFAKAARGEASPEHSVLKLVGSELEQRLALLAADALGAEALDVEWDRHAFYDDASGPPPWSIQYLRSFSNTIAGGTSEIQRNIIAQRVLGLPRR